MLFFEWTGRVDNNEKERRLHEVIENINIENVKESSNKNFALIGFECDEGVRRNKGRVGASKAPNEIRRFLANTPYHFQDKNIIDVGNVTCTENELEVAQKQLGENISNLINEKYTPIIIGGGHETFYGHYLGVREAVGKDKTIGMINLDAHFDLRMDQLPTSGTMFRQILEKDENASYLCIGIQELGNTEQLFVTANDLRAKYIKETDMYPLENTFNTIDDFAKEHDVIIYTICMDVVDQSAAPGVSAPAPFGLDPKTVRKVTEHILHLDNFLSIDFSEVNPNHDVEDKTVRLVSYFIAEALLHLNRKRLS